MLGFKPQYFYNSKKFWGDTHGYAEVPDAYAAEVLAIKGIRGTHTKSEDLAKCWDWDMPVGLGVKSQ